MEMIQAEIVVTMCSIALGDYSHLVLLQFLHRLDDLCILLASEFRYWWPVVCAYYVEFCSRPSDSWCCTITSEINSAKIWRVISSRPTCADRLEETHEDWHHEGRAALATATHSIPGCRHLHLVSCNLRLKRAVCALAAVDTAQKYTNGP